MSRPRFCKTLPSLILLGLSTLPHPASACSSCGCTLSSDWDAQGISGRAGFKLDLRYDFINQNQLRAGGHQASRAEINAALASGSLGETEQATLNRYYTLTLDYNSGQSWGINIQAPFYDRFHSTIDAASTDASTAHLNEIADIRIVGRYQGLTPDGDTGLLFGLKLPSGKTTADFDTGPLAGSALDRSLQAGTGSTDLILGLYRFGALDRDWDWFAQGLFQAAIASKDGYRPGNALNLNGGLRYMSLGRLVPQIQLNAKTGNRDSGANADPDNSGGTAAYLSPGLTYGIAPAAKLYGFAQLPVYQYVHGIQLAPRWNVSVGATFSF